MDAHLTTDADSPSGTLQRGLAILDLLSHGDQPTVSEIIEQVGLSKSAAFRVLATLRDHELVTWDSTLSGVVLPAIPAVQLGVAGLRVHDPWAEGRVLLAEVAAELGEAGLMAIRDGDEMVYIAHEDRSDATVGVRRLLGVRRPMHASSLGKAFLSALPEDEFERSLAGLALVRYNDHTITDPDDFRAEIAATRERGWAIDNEEHEEGVVCFGAPIVDHLGYPLASISVAGPRERILRNRDRIIEQLTHVAARVSQRIPAS